MFKHKKIIILSFIVILAVGGYFVVNSQNAAKESAKLLSSLIEVGEGDIVDKISGTGIVSANLEYNITTLVSGTVQSSPFEEGAIVRAGDTLYTIDTKEIEKQITTAKISLERAEVNLRQNLKAKEDLVSVSLYSGKIEKLYVEKGDFITAGAKIADVIDSANLILKIPFNTADIERIHLGDAAKITLVSTSSNLSGTVSRIYDTSESPGGYRNVTYIEIALANPGAIGKGEKAYAVIGGIGCNSEGEFMNMVEKSIVSNGTGQITQLLLKEGGLVSKGELVMVLKNDQIINAIDSSDIAIKEAKNVLENLNLMLDDYRIKAPSPGTVITKSVKKGDNVMPGASLMTISDINTLYVDVEIDEIYISKIKEGQEAVITAEAVKDKSFKGRVVRIDDVGVAKNGVTYYPVKVRIDQSGELKVGMNLEVDIINEVKENLVLVPRGAVENGKVMLFKEDALNEVTIETGIRDEGYIEVISGLEKGDKIVLGSN